MAHESAKVYEIIDRAVGHNWSIPNFSVALYGSPRKCEIWQSRCGSAPIGSLLLWDSQQPTETRSASDAQSPSLWVVDGQQRVTALCIMFGRKPYWWSSSEEWNKTIRKYDIRFDIHAVEPPYFWVANAAIRKVKGDRYVPLSRLLVLDTKKETDWEASRILLRRLNCRGGAMAWMRWMSTHA